MSTSKKVLVFSTGQGTNKTVETTATTWGGLQKDLDKAGIKYQGMKAVDGATKNNFENPDGLLPDGNLNLFLFPEKTKSGATKALASAGLTPTGVKSAIKELIATYGEHAEKHFNVDKKYTAKSASDLRELLDAYKSPKGKAAKAETPKADTKAVAKKAGSKTTKELPAPAEAKKSTGVANLAKSVGKSTAVSKSKTAVAKTSSVSTDFAIDNIVELIQAIEGGSPTAKDAAIKAVKRLGVTKDLGEEGLVTDPKELQKMSESIARGLKGIR